MPAGISEAHSGYLPASYASCFFWSLSPTRRSGRCLRSELSSMPRIAYGARRGESLRNAGSEIPGVLNAYPLNLEDTINDKLVRVERMAGATPQPAAHSRGD